MNRPPRSLIWLAVVLAVAALGFSTRFLSSDKRTTFVDFDVFRGQIYRATSDGITCDGALLPGGPAWADLVWVSSAGEAWTIDWGRSRILVWSGGQWSTAHRNHRRWSRGDRFHPVQFREGPQGVHVIIGGDHLAGTSAGLRRQNVPGAVRAIAIRQDATALAYDRGNNPALSLQTATGASVELPEVEPLFDMWFLGDRDLVGLTWEGDVWRLHPTLESIPPRMAGVTAAEDGTILGIDRQGEVRRLTADGWSEPTTSRVPFESEIELVKLVVSDGVLYVRGGATSTAPSRPQLWRQGDNGQWTCLDR